METTTHQHYLIALGSNLGDRASHMARARAEIDRRIGPVLRMSKAYETKPVGAADQMFLNAALVTATALQPPAVLQALLAIEEDMGRVRRERWGNRIIDLDILLWLPPETAKGGVTATFQDPSLTIPHPEMLTRDFVMKPAGDVAPDWVHPRTGKRLRPES